jgi:hypothetical protein
MNLSMDKTVDS